VAEYARRSATEAITIAEHRVRRSARHAHGHNHDGRARHYALRAVRQSPARVEAPEPNVWLPILDITGELEALDLAGELELLTLESGRGDLDAELRDLSSSLLSSPPVGLDDAVAELADLPALAAAAHPGELEPEPEVLAISLFDDPDPAPDEAREPVLESEPGSVAGPEPAEAPAAPAEPLDALLASAPPAPGAGPEPGVQTRPGPSRAERRHAAHRRDVRNRIAGTALVVALLGALATVTPSVVGASVPQRHITVTLDGHTVDRTVRLATVGEVLDHEGIVVHRGDRVAPAASAELREDMNIVVRRAFPVTVEIDGVTRELRTTARTRDALRRELGIARGLIPDGPFALESGAKVAFRTPHAVTIGIDGKTIAVPRSGALDVGELLREQGITIGPRDEVAPAVHTRVANGLQVHVYRLAEGQVAERVAIPFTTETRDDPNLPRGQTRVLQPGVDGERRDVYKVTTRDDGTVMARVKVGSEQLAAPVAQIVARGTAAPAPSASGSATWYGTGPGPGTCAHLSLPFGTVVTITNRETGATAQCRVQDRGPETWTGHIIDLAPDVFRRLAPLSQGVLSNVTLSY
jgi:uncharacterized protein YabE (DUF348 family)